MTDAEKLDRAMRGEFVGGVLGLAPVLVAEIIRLRAAGEVACQLMPDPPPVDVAARLEILRDELARAHQARREAEARAAEMEARWRSVRDDLAMLREALDDELGEVRRLDEALKNFI